VLSSRIIWSATSVPSIHLHDVYGDFRSFVLIISKGGISAMGLCVNGPNAARKYLVAVKNRETD